MTSGIGILVALAGGIAAAPGASANPPRSREGGMPVEASGAFSMPSGAGAAPVSSGKMLCSGGSPAAAEGASPGLGKSVSLPLSVIAGAGGRDGAAAGGSTGELSGSPSSVVGAVASLAGANA